ncbi:MULTISPECIES: hypothetical protein [Kocuria]|uniref:hypothetical protein n=1 Tax=Kocuria TaxID=57493 RepID=UPI000EAE0003|nr:MULTISPECIES: hypothetical protein [Kocuria]WIW68555.1 hypothetical protein P8S73_01305 [Kocuria sp. ChxB]MCT1545512.1 hypothetical protein [Kocuria rhizophila]MCT2170866.1 hypothetical protein [Kocuria rhizophila]MDN3462933.1 hypothetical protein [Kocuria sp. APC 4018]WSY89082.1 hypothetical protein OH783_03645 [Kocuria rhizophila]
MTDYALNDRGSLDVVTENFYDTEIMRVFGGLSAGRAQTWNGMAALVPEPDNPFDPRTVSVRVGENKVAHLSSQDAHRYWHPLSRVIASGYTPVVPLHLEAELLRQDGVAEVDARAVIDIAPPDLLFPLNTAPAQAAVLPQGSSIKVLDEQDFAEYLHSIVPASGEGRVILTLEVNKVRNSHGVTVDTVDVLYERKQVGRLSTQMSQQFIPIINHAFDHDLLTAVWGTIRGSSFEVSMTLQAARAPEVPAQWFTELPNDVPELLPEAEQYEVPAAYVAVESDHGRNSKKWRRGFTAAHPEATGAGSPASGARALAARWRGGESTRTGQDTAGALVAEHDAAGTAPAARNTAGSTVAGVARGLRPLVTALLALTVLLVVVGIVLLGVEPLATTLVMIVALATGFMAVYLHRTL